MLEMVFFSRQNCPFFHWKHSKVLPVLPTTWEESELIRYLGFSTVHKPCPSCYQSLYRLENFSSFLFILIRAQGPQKGCVHDLTCPYLSSLTFPLHIIIYEALCLGFCSSTRPQLKTPPKWSQNYLFSLSIHAFCVHKYKYQYSSWTI